MLSRTEASGEDVRRLERAVVVVEAKREEDDDPGCCLRPAKPAVGATKADAGLSKRASIATAAVVGEMGAMAPGTG